jgi:ribosomal protein S27AE
MTPNPAASPDAPAGAAAMLPAREGLLGLAERLEDGKPVHPGGVERARRLCPPHQWGCPVIMKADPEHVAWTCGRCGHIAVTDDAAVRPA